MLAQQLTAFDGPGALRLAEVPEPPAGDGLVVVDLDAAGVAYPDLLQTRGRYQVRRELPCVLGVEGAGRVRNAPDGSGLHAGDRVAVLGLEGTWQQVVALPAPFVFPLPDALGTDAAAGFLMNYLTCWFALVERARARPGETVLVHGAAGGVGTAALQVAAALGLPSIAVVSDDAKAEVARRNRAEHVVGVADWRHEVRELTGGRGVDIVVDPVGGDRFTDSLRSLARSGRLVVLGFVGGDIPTVKVNRLLMANTSVIGAGWGEFIRAEPGYLREQWDEMAPLLASGVLRVEDPVRYELADAPGALAALESRAALGKLVLTF